MGKRLFIAIDLPSSLSEQIEQKLLRKLRSRFHQIRWEEKDKLHLTLKFLGECPAGKITVIYQQLDKCCRLVEPFYLHINQIGYFVHPRLIVYLTVEKTKPLVSLVSCLETELEKIGFEREHREFLPHITLGRGKRQRLSVAQWRSLGERLRRQGKFQQKFLASKVALVASKLHRDGAEYQLVKEVSLLPKTKR